MLPGNNLVTCINLNRAILTKLLIYFYFLMFYRVKREVLACDLLTLILLSTILFKVRPEPDLHSLLRFLS